MRLKAIKNWVGLEGSVKRGDTLDPMTAERGNELVDSGRAIEIKGGPEVEDVKAETKEAPKPRKPRARKVTVEKGE